MTIEIKQLMDDVKNPTEKENIELAKVLNFLDENDINYDLNPPENKK